MAILLPCPIRLGLRTHVRTVQLPVFAGFPGYHPPYGPPYGSWVQYRMDIDAASVRVPRARSVSVKVVVA